MKTGGLLILTAEDDPNDIFLLKRAFLKNGINNPTHVSPNGEDAIAYLRGQGEYADRIRFPFPGLLITDIKMPRSGGFELLEWLRNHSECQVIPIIVLSSSNDQSDVRRAYHLGANAYIHKPTTFEQLTSIIRITFDFWSICERPQGLEGCADV